MSPGGAFGNDIVWIPVDTRSDADVYAEYAVALTRYATGLVGPADAPDVVSEAVIRLMASPVWKEASNRRALLYRAVLFEARSMQRSAIRRRRREIAAFDPGVGGQPDPMPEVWNAFARLSPQQRSVIFLTYWEDLDPASIGALLAVSEGTVRKQLARARRRLREVLSD